MGKVAADVVKLLRKWPRMVFATAMLVIGISVALSWLVPPAYESCGVIRIGQIAKLGQMYFTSHPDREIVDRRFRVHLDYPQYLEHADDLVSRLRGSARRMVTADGHLLPSLRVQADRGANRVGVAVGA